MFSRLRSPPESDFFSARADDDVAAFVEAEFHESAIHAAAAVALAQRCGERIAAA